LKTFIFDISLERLWYGCYDLKKQKQYAADETDLDDCISQDGNISDAPMFAVTLRKLMRQNGTPFVGENAIVLFHPCVAKCTKTILKNNKCLSEKHLEIYV